jgi:O-methyltransferase
MKRSYKKIANSLAKRLINFVNLYGDFYISHKPDFQKEGNGFNDFEKVYKNWTAYTSLNNAGDMSRLYFLFLQLRRLDQEKIDGAIAELGVFKGITAKLFCELSPHRKLYLLDTFEGFNKNDAIGDMNQGLSNATEGSFSHPIEAVRDFIGANSAKFIQGYFPESSSQLPNDERYAFVHLDADLYQPQLEGLKYFYPKVVKGGIIVVHDCTNSFAGSRKALDEFFADKPENPVLMPDKSGSAVVIKYAD